MKKHVFVGMVFFSIILTAVLVVSAWVNAQTQKSVSMTALEQKLYQAALKEGQFNWWDQHSLKEAAIWTGAFNARYPGIKVNYFEGTQGVVTQKYLTEYKAGRATADNVSPEPLAPFKEQKLLMDLSDIIKDTNYPLQFCLKDLTGVTEEITVNVNAYNTKLVSPQDLPRSYEDLLDPKWKGKIGIEDRLKPFLRATEYYGEQWIVDYLKKLSKQEPIFVSGSTAVVNLLNTGEFPIAIGAQLHRVIIFAAQGQPVGLVPINPAVAATVSPVCIPITAPHPNAAKLFIRWELTPEGQALYDKYKFAGNPLPGSGTNQSKFLEKHGVKVFSNTEWLSDNESRLEKLYQEAIGYRKK